MLRRSLSSRRRLGTLIPVLACMAWFSATAYSQQCVTRSSLYFQVRHSSQRLKMIVNSSRIFTMEQKIPRAQVNNPDIVNLQPLAANQIQVSSLKPGVTQVNLWDENENLYTVDLIVMGDARELEMILQSTFPEASLRIRPMNSSILIQGYVPRPELVSRITTIAEDYYPKVITNMTVGGVQTVLLHVKVLEVSRGKLRQLGIDWNIVWNSGDFLVQGASGLVDVAGSTTGFAAGGADTIRFGLDNSDHNFTALIDFLQQKSAVKVLAEPTVVTMSGRPASFLVGGEFPILVPSGIATATIEFKEFGTRVDFVPIVLGNGRLRLEVRPIISEIDVTQNVSLGAITVPGLRTRYVDTGVEMSAGQTLALAGLLQERVEVVNRGVPWLSDLPYIGAPFRRIEENVVEVELIVLVTPEIVDSMDPHEVPPCGPGQFTTSPNDWEFYLKGYSEVPKCYSDGSCSHCQESRFDSAPVPLDAPQEQIPTGEYLPPTEAAANYRSPASAAPNTHPAATRRGWFGSQLVSPSSYDRNNATSTHQSNHRNVSTCAPTMIGPVGYDVQE